MAATDPREHHWRRKEWTIFSQGVNQLLRESYNGSASGFLAEADILATLTLLRQDVHVGTQTRRVPSVIRNIENAPNDAVIVVIKGPLQENLPADNSTDLEWWQWARTGPENVGFVTIDAKLVNLSNSQFASDKVRRPFYSWTKPRSVETNSALVFAQVEGIVDHIAIMPARIWSEAVERAGVGIEQLTSRAPLWMPLFFVRTGQLVTAVEHIQKTALGLTPWYMNPSTGVTLEGWNIPIVDRPDLRPTASNALQRNVSFNGFLGLVHNIQSTDKEYRIHFSPMAPLICDFCLEMPGIGFLRFELKESASTNAFLESCRLQDRRNPFQLRRSWHVLYILRPGKRDICVTRNDTFEGDLPTREWLLDRRVDNFAQAAQHIRSQAAAAKITAATALRDSEPADLVAGLPNYRLVLPELTFPDPWRPIGQYPEVYMLPWLRHLINVQCAEARFGCCFALGASNPIGTHIFVSCLWSEAEQTAFNETGRLPFELWEARALHSNCIILRFHDYRSSATGRERGLLSTKYSIRGEQWRQPVAAWRKFFVVGWAGYDDMDRYLLLPSEFTALGSDRHLFSPPQVRHKDKGGHFFHIPEGLAKMELGRPPGILPYPGPGDDAFLRYFLKDQRINAQTLPNFEHDVSSGGLNTQLAKVLRNPDTRGRVHHGTWPATDFDFSPYHHRVDKILQSIWDCGCWTGMHKPEAKSNAAPPRSKARSLTEKC